MSKNVIFIAISMNLGKYLSMETDTESFDII